MHQPEVRLRRSSGWTTESWEGSLPRIASALNKAVQGLGALGVSYTQPKTGSIIRVTSHDGFGENMGLAVSATSFSTKAIVPRGAIISRRAANEWSACSFHELIHCARYEHTDAWTLAERVVTEGFAYLAEHQYTSRFLAGQVCTRFFDFDLAIDDRLDAEFRETIRKSNSINRTNGWFSRTVCVDMPAGGMYGAQRIHALLESGYEYDDLLPLPAEEILEL